MERQLNNINDFPISLKNAYGVDVDISMIRVEFGVFFQNHISLKNAYGGSGLNPHKFKKRILYNIDGEREKRQGLLIKGEGITTTL